MRPSALTGALVAGLVAASVVLLACWGAGGRDGDAETHLLVCAVLDELGADTVDPRIVDACPVP